VSISAEVLTSLVSVAKAADFVDGGGRTIGWDIRRSH
jgi:hypothetical protein